MATGVPRTRGRAVFPRGDTTHHVQREGETQQKEPDVEVESVDERMLIGVVVPPARD